MKKLIIFSFLISTAALLSGQIINIPADYPTIQQGIDAASNGDTVLVNTGTYVENINFNSKNITVASNYLITLDESYIANTIINGNQNGSVVKFESSEDSTALLSGFTITNGYNSDGGGIYVDSASPTLEYLHIKFNEVDGSGGGISFYYSNSKLRNIIIANNTSNFGFTYYQGGGGIWSCLSTLVMDSIVVQFNESWVGGGIKFDESSNVVITNSNISNNTAFGGGSPAGGGLCIDNCIVDIQNTIISNNITFTSCAPFASGGGIYCHASILNLSGVIIKNNESNLCGGGIYFFNSDVTFNSNNKCSIYENKAPIGHDISGGNFNEVTTVILDTFSVLYPTDYYVGNYKEFDFEISHGLIEQVDTNLFISPTGDNSNSGLSEEDPVKNIQYALSILKVDSLHPNNLFLLNGVYSASQTQEYFPINVPDYCQIIGMSAESTILNAEGWGDVLEITDNSENTISGLTITGGKGGMRPGGILCVNSSPFITNLIIQENNHWNPAWMGQGGGLLLASSNPVLKNVLITNNYAYRGGGAYISSSNPKLINVTFSGNDNGGIEISGVSEVELTNTIMWGDSAIANISEIMFANADTNYASISIERSDIFGGLEGIGINENDTVYWLEGNIDEDPMFVGTGDYQLNDNSPCIDTGTPDTTGLNLPAGDIIGNLRIWDGDNNGTEIIDMGAYEYGSVPVYISEPIVKESKDQVEMKIFPNPFYQSTTIELELNEKNKITLAIYNQLGEKIEAIFEGEKEKGNFNMSVDFENLPTGVYLIKLRTDKEFKTQKIIKR